MIRSRVPSRRRKPSSRKGPRPSAAALREWVRPIVRALVAEQIGNLEDRLDYLESEASLGDGKPVPASRVWKELGL